MKDEVAIGSVFYVWGDHHKGVAEREGLFGREVRLERVTRKDARKQPWVEARLVSKWGKPSLAYAEGATGATRPCPRSWVPARSTSGSG